MWARMAVAAAPALADGRRRPRLPRGQDRHRPLLRRAPASRDRDAPRADPHRRRAGDGAGGRELLGSRLAEGGDRPMPKRLRLTRRFPVAMTEDGYRRLRRFADEAGLDEGEALSLPVRALRQRHRPRQPEPPAAAVQFRAGGARHDEKRKSDRDASQSNPQSRHQPLEGRHDDHLHCFGESGNAYKAALTLTLCGIEWEPVFVDFFNGGSRSARLPRAQPHGRGAGAGGRRTRADAVGRDPALGGRADGTASRRPATRRCAGCSSTTTRSRRRPARCAST